MSVHDLFPPQIIYEEKSRHWINCHDVLHFFNAGSDDLTVGSTVRFIWSSEETGFRHLYKIEIQLVDCDMNRSPNLSDSQTSNGDNEDRVYAKHPKLDQKFGTDF